MIKSTLTIAIPVTGGRLHEHFGGATDFALVEVALERGGILSQRSVAAPPHAPGVFPPWLRSQGVRLLIVGGIGRRALDLFAREGIEVRAGEPGALVEDLVSRYLGGTLAEAPAGCAGHGHHHEQKGAPATSCHRADERRNQGSGPNSSEPENVA